VKNTRPEPGWVKLNTDGSSHGNPRFARGWGLIHDEIGNWIVEFACKVGVTTCFLTELWALRDAIVAISQL